MAFYHVGGCNCPSGCCDCGGETKVTIKTKLHDAFYGRYQRASEAQEVLDRVNIVIETLECFGAEYLHAADALRNFRKKLINRHTEKKMKTKRRGGT